MLGTKTTFSKKNGKLFRVQELMKLDLKDW